MRAQRKSTMVAASTAVVLGVMLSGCSGSPGADDTGASATMTPGDSAAPSGTPDGGTSTAQGADLATATFPVSWQDALETASDNFEGSVAEIELDWKRDRYAYKVELVSDTEEYEVSIDAESGEQFNERTEKIESDDLAEKQAEVVDVDSIVSWDDALATALDAQSGRVNEWKLEGTSRGPQYQFDIDDESGEDYEITVDAVTGELAGTDD